MVLALIAMITAIAVTGFIAPPDGQLQCTNAIASPWVRDTEPSSHALIDLSWAAVCSETISG